MSKGKPRFIVCVLMLSVCKLVSAQTGDIIVDGSGDIAGENIQHANGNIFDQVLLTGRYIKLQAKPGQITRVSFMDEDEDIVQIEMSGSGTFTVTLDPATFRPPALPPRYNQQVMYVTGKPSVVIDGADSSTFFSIFTVGRINAANQALFPEGQVYDAEADVALVEVINSTGIGGMQLSNTVFSGSTGNLGVIAREVPIAVRLTIGDIDASGNAVPYLLFGGGSFFVPVRSAGLRIAGGDLAQSNGANIRVAAHFENIEVIKLAPPFFEFTGDFSSTIISQDNFKSDGTRLPARDIRATFQNLIGQISDTRPPKSVTGFYGINHIEGYTVGWDKPTDSDYAGTEILEGNTLAEATRVGFIRGDEFSKGGEHSGPNALPPIPRTVWVRHLDKSGNYTVANSIIVTPIPDPTTDYGIASLSNKTFEFTFDTFPPHSVEIFFFGNTEGVFTLFEDLIVDGTRFSSTRTGTFTYIISANDISKGFINIVEEDITLRNSNTNISGTIEEVADRYSTPLPKSAQISAELSVFFLKAKSGEFSMLVTLTDGTFEFNSGTFEQLN